MGLKRAPMLPRLDLPTKRIHRKSLSRSTQSLIHPSLIRPNRPSYLTRSMLPVRKTYRHRLTYRQRLNHPT